MRETTLEDYRQRILRVLVHIQRHLDEPLALDDLARIAHFSPFHFHRVFRGLVGEALAEHVRRLRLERAAQQLRDTGHGVTRIAFEAGYETHEAFTRAFRAMFGEAPSRWRVTHRRDEGDTAWPTLQSPRGAVTMNVTIERVPARRVAFVRCVGPYQTSSIGRAWERLCAWAGPRGLLGPGTVCLGLSHDDPEVTPADKLRYDACIVVGEDVQPEGEIGIQVIPGGDYAKATHVGPYERLCETYAELVGRWAPTSGRDLGTAPCFEVYRNNPQVTPPEQLVTDVYASLA